MNSYSFLKTRSTRKKLNAPLPNPTNKQSMIPASLEVNATPIEVPTTIERYMNHFSVVFMSQFKTIKSIVPVTQFYRRMAYQSVLLNCIPRKVFKKKVCFLIKFQLHI